MNCTISEIKAEFFSISLLVVLFIIFNQQITESKEKKYKANRITAEDLHLSIENPDARNRSICAGERCYIIGMQDGNFPPLGWHIADEMGGVWFPPLKALDGIWLRINGKYILAANKYTRKAACSEYEFTYDKLRITRKDIALDNISGALFIYTIKNSSSVRTPISLEILTRIHPIFSFPFVQNLKEYERNKEAFNFSTKVYIDSLTGEVMASAENLGRYISIKSNIFSDNIKVEKIKDLPFRESNSFCRQNEEDVVIKYNLIIDKGGEQKLIIGVAGSILSVLDASSSVEEIIKNADNLLMKKENKYVRFANQSVLNTPDKKINEAFLWNKLNTAMQILNTPGLGTGTIAGYPDYPWYFSGDGEFTTPALLAIGQIEEVKNYLRLMARTSNGINNSSGKIIHELVTDGTVYWGRNKDIGNTNETCQFVKAVGQVWKWTGDKEFLDELYPTIKKGMLDWLINTQIAKDDIFPGGNGLDEVDGWGPKRLDVQCYAVEGLLALADMAEYLKDFEASKKAKYWAEKIKYGINKIWWMEDKGYYANSLSKDNKPILLGDISAVPLESKIVDNQRAKILFDAISKSELNNKYGWGSMSISSGIVAVAQANYGRMNEALHYIKGIANYSSTEMPGDLPEHHPPFPVNTNHEQWSTNTIQLWGGYGLHWPLIANITGIQPDIPKHIIRVLPDLPSSWDKIECSNVLVGKDTLNLSVQKENNQMIIKLTHYGKNKLEIGTMVPQNKKISKASLNGKELTHDQIYSNNVINGKEIFIKTDLNQVVLKLETL